MAAVMNVSGVCGLGKHWFNVYDRCPVDGFERSDSQLTARNFEDGDAV
jgi:hypothetical protein